MKYALWFKSWFSRQGSRFKYLGLRWKMLLGALLILFTVSATMISVAHQQLLLTYQSERQVHSAAYQAEFSARINQHFSDLSRVAATVIDANRAIATDYPTLSNYFDDSFLQNLRLLWQLSSIQLLDEYGIPLTRASIFNNSIDWTKKVQNQNEPSAFIDCVGECSLVAMYPFRLSNQKTAHLVLAKPLDSVFNDLEGAHELTMAIALKRMPNQQTRTYYNPDWKMDFLHLPADKNYKKLFDNASAKQATLGRSAISISYIDQPFDVYNFVLDLSFLKEQYQVFTVWPADAALTQVSRSTQILLLFAAIVCTLAATLLFFGIRVFLKRLLRIVKVLPLLPAKQFSLARQEMGQKHLSVMSDELDEVEHAVIRLTNQLESLTSEVESKKEELQTLSFKDALTQLPNRHLLEHHIERALMRIDAPNTGLCLLIIDLDNFKRINDALGMSVGDKVLSSFASRLSAIIPVDSSDLLARIGSDEFGMLLKNVETQQQVNSIIKQIQAALSEPLLAQGETIRCTSSIGGAFIDKPETSVSNVMRYADLAKFKAKDMIGNSLAWFDQEEDQQQLSAISLETLLHSALKKRQFVLHYQPKYSVSDDRVRGFEALVRWQHPQQGLWAPGRFIPLLEKSGQITPLTFWAIREVCRQVGQWRDAGYEELSVSVNLSSHDFSEAIALAEHIEKCLTDFSVPPHLLELEITESSLIKNFDAVQETVDRLRQIGVTVALDDFGTGYSSFSYLRQLTVDVLKIDREFLLEVQRSGRDRSLVQAFILIAHKLGLKVVAEGVESQAQRRFLKLQGCDLAQGYYYSKPMPVDDAENLLYEQSQRHQQEALAISD